MSTGINDLKSLLANRYFNYDKEIDCEHEYGLEDTPAEVNSSNDLFDYMTDDIRSGETTGKEVVSIVANLANMLLQKKVPDSAITEKRASYPWPKNIYFPKAIRVNKPIWKTLNAFTRVRESNLQPVQNDFLTSTVPLVRVMEKIFEATDDMSSLDATEILAMLHLFSRECEYWYDQVKT